MSGYQRRKWIRERERPKRLPQLPVGKTLKCGPDFHNAVYYNDGKSMVAKLVTGYLVAHGTGQNSNGALQCRGSSDVWKCVGQWNDSVPAVVTFVRLENEQYSARFNVFLAGAEVPNRFVTYACQVEDDK